MDEFLSRGGSGGFDNSAVSGDGSGDGSGSGTPSGAGSGDAISTFLALMGVGGGGGGGAADTSSTVSALSGSNHGIDFGNKNYTSAPYPGYRANTYRGPSSHSVDLSTTTNPNNRPYGGTPNFWGF